MKILVLAKDLYLKEKIIGCPQLKNKVDEVIQVAILQHLKRNVQNKPIHLMISDLSFGGREMVLINQMKQCNPQLRLILYLTHTQVNQKLEVAVRGLEVFEKIVFQELGDDRLLQILIKEVNELAQRHGEVLPVQSQSEVVLVKYHDLLFIEKVNRRLVFHLSQRKIEAYGTLKDLEVQLPFYFYRSHRSYIINLQQIKMMIPQGRSYQVVFPYIEEKAILSYDRQQELADQFLL